MDDLSRLENLGVKLVYKPCEGYLFVWNPPFLVCDQTHVEVAAERFLRILDGRAQRDSPDK